DPAKGGIDYQMQGEYAGPFGTAKLGAQVIARGDGNFDIVFFPGGLPGDGWDAKTKHRAIAKYEPKPELAATIAVVTSKDGWSGTIILSKTNLLRGKSPKGEEFEILKVERQSKTLGAKPPTGAIVLFDESKKLDEWTN